jgi:thioredoxin-related protein
MEPVVSDLEKKHGDRISVVVLNVYENMEKAEKYDVRVVPTILLLDGAGDVLERVEGYMSLSDIEKMLEKHHIL